MKKGPLSSTIFMLLALMLLAACTQPDAIALATPPASEEPMIEPTQTPQSEPISSLANVDSAELIMSDAPPISVSVIARGSLPDGCTEIASRSQTQAGNAYSIEITTVRDPLATCTQSIMPFEEVFNLNVLNMPAGTYTVNVNGVIQTFVFAAQNSAPEPTVEPTTTAQPEPTATSASTNTGDGAFSVTGSVFHDLCAVADQSADESVPAASEGCVELADGGFAANGVLDADEPPLIGIAVNLGEGACPAQGAIVSAETDETGAFSFADVSPGNYCLFITSTAEPNASVLIPGDWTTHDDEASVEIVVVNDTDTDPFGWDYQFLPIPEAARGETLVRAACVDLFAFDGDVTIPDDAPFEPGSPVIKTWRLINTGSCTWTEDYALTYLRGDQMNAPTEVAIQEPVAPGEAVNITVEMTAPDVQGNYRGDWIMRSDFDQLFGVGGDPEDPIWLQIVVVEPETVGSISGLIWNDGCDQSAYTFGDPTLPAGCLQNPNGTVRGDGLYDTSQETPLPDITLNIGNGACGETEFVRSQRSAEDGTYIFPNLLTGTYCIYIEVLTDANYSRLIPGNFTVPQPGRSGVTVTLQPNIDFTSINFAWDPLEE